MAIQVRQRFQKDIAIASSSDEAQAVYRFDDSLPKPCIHPLVTPGGVVLSGYEMSDHLWHRGLWYTIKLINGTNFWEEIPPFGRQISTAEPKVEPVTDSRTRIFHQLQWTSAQTGPVIDETRTVMFDAPGDDGIGTIDFSTRLLPLQDLTLDRTPYTTWGGYSGLAFRGSRELHQVSYELPDHSIVPSIIGDRHEWMILRAAVDGGVDRHISIGMIDHPSNPRSPSPWYCRADPSYTLANAAFLFHEPMAVAEGEALTFHYRVMYRDGFWTGGEFEKCAASFRESTPRV